MSLRERIQKLADERRQLQADRAARSAAFQTGALPVNAETVARYFLDNRRWRLSALSKETALSTDELSSLLTRDNGFVCSPAPQCWYSFNPLVAELARAELSVA